MSTHWQNIRKATEASELQLIKNKHSRCWLILDHRFRLSCWWADRVHKYKRSLTPMHAKVYYRDVQTRDPRAKLWSLNVLMWPATKSEIKTTFLMQILKTSWLEDKLKIINLMSFLCIPLHVALHYLYLNGFDLWQSFFIKLYSNAFVTR